MRRQGKWFCGNLSLGIASQDFARYTAMQTMTDKQFAVELLDRLDAGQLAAVVHLLKVMTDPLSRKLANVMFDDEPFTEKERHAVAEADAWLLHHEPISNEEVLAEFGLTLADWEKMGQTPLPPDFNG